MSDEKEKGFDKPSMEIIKSLQESPSKMIAELVKVLGKGEKHIRMFTDSTSERIQTFGVLDAVNKVLCSPLLDEYVTSIDERFIGYKRLGRKEFVILGRSIGQMAEEKRGFWNAFKDRIRNRRIV